MCCIRASRTRLRNLRLNRYDEFMKNANLLRTRRTRSGAGGIARFMIIVADSSALVALAVCNGCHLLDTLYQTLRDAYPTGKSISQRRDSE